MSKKNNKEEAQSAVSDAFWQYDLSHWYMQLESRPEGLLQREAQKRLHSERKPSFARRRFSREIILFVRQYQNPMMLLLIGAVLLSAFLGDTSDVLIILFILLFTGLLSFFQERKAGKVAEKLQSMLSMKSTVLRSGREQELDNAEVVRGDVILLNAGDMIPADCLLIESNELHANESALTGESFPARKAPGIIPADTPLARRTNCLWEGTSIVSGDGRALVIQTAGQTIFGEMARRATATVETSFEKGVKDFGIFLMRITLLLALFILLVSLLNHKGIIESALFSLALAVGMAPELLPAISTISMSAGAQRLLKKKVIVKKLSSIQNLGEVNMLCTDKTGTLTEGAIAIAGFVTVDGKDSAKVKQLACWNAMFESGYANPIDESLKKLKVDAPLPQKTGEVPYDFIRKRLSVAVKTEEEKLLISKGAFSQILEVCTYVESPGAPLSDIKEWHERLEGMFEQFGRQGLRSIAVCYRKISDGDAVSRDLEKEMIFAGFVLLNDPVKAGMVETLDALAKLKVGLRIISGDSRSVALAVAGKVGMHEPGVITGPELLHVSPEALRQRVRKTQIFAEIEPQQKERIILALRHWYTVAYLGDGINDVAAINAADVGISVENAVDVAREAADFVLMEKDLTVLCDGIMEGRKTFANTLKYLYISTGSTFGNMCSVAAASLILPFLPMLPKQILLTNFLTDFPFLMVSQDKVDPEQSLKAGKWNLKLIRNYMLVFGIHSSLFDMLTFLSLYVVFRVNEEVFRSAWFIESVLSELFILFIIRTHRNFFKSRPGNALLILGLLAFMATIILPYTPLAAKLGLSPLPADLFGYMLLIVLAYVVSADLLKVWFFRRFYRL